jgi:hypothetical protein
MKKVPVVRKTGTFDCALVVFVSTFAFSALFLAATPKPANGFPSAATTTSGTSRAMRAKIAKVTKTPNLLFRSCAQLASLKLESLLPH